MNRISFLFKDRILYIIIILLGCQQFPIINVGGSLKTYEVLGFILMGFNMLHYNSKKKIDKISFYSFVFFIAVPLFCYIYSSLFYDYPEGYYMRWPKATLSIKSNYYVYPIFLLFCLSMNYSVFNSLKDSRALYENIYKLMKAAVIFGTIISLYSFFAIYVYDFIHYLPRWIQFKNTTGGTRTSGFSQEPGTYVLYQTWICLFLWYSKSNYTKHWWYILSYINIASLIMTQSTALWGLILSILISVFVFRDSVRVKTKTVLAIMFTVFTTFAVIIFFGYQMIVNDFFLKKLKTFVVINGHKTFDSGGVRKYLSDISIQVFYDYPFLGTGYGRSMFYMYQYEYKVGISVFQERLNLQSTSLNMFTLIAAEMGIVGIITFLLFYFSIMKKFWIKRNQSGLHKMFFVGGFVELIAMFSLYTPHALFLWGYLGLGLGYIKYFDRQVALDQHEKGLESVQLNIT